MEQLVNQLASYARRQPSEQQSAVDALRAYISAGNYAKGDRLPPERILIGELGMTRGLLRRALDALERDGTIWRHVGKGTFVAGHGAVGSENAIEMLGRQMTPVRMIQARLCIEPAIAWDAAVHASREAVIRIKLACEVTERANSWADYESQDDLFHRSIAEASDNVLLLTLFDQLNQVRRAVAGGTVVRETARPPQNHSSFDEHRIISNAIEARDAQAAHKAMKSHIGSVSKRLFDEI